MLHMIVVLGLIPSTDLNSYLRGPVTASWIGVDRSQFDHNSSALRLKAMLISLSDQSRSNLFILAYIIWARYSRCHGGYDAGSNSGILYNQLVSIKSVWTCLWSTSLSWHSLWGRGCERNQVRVCHLKAGSIARIISGREWACWTGYKRYMANKYPGIYKLDTPPLCQCMKLMPFDMPINWALKAGQSGWMRLEI